MEVLDIGLERSDIFPPTIVTTMVFQMTKLLKFMQVMEHVGIGLLIPSTRTLEITESIIVVVIFIHN